MKYNNCYEYKKNIMNDSIYIINITIILIFCYNYSAFNTKRAIPFAIPSVPLVVEQHP